MQTYCAQLRRHHEPRPGDAAVRQHRLRAARPRRRPRSGAQDRLRHGHHAPSSTATRRRAWAACASASRRSRWPTPTRRSPRAASATSPSRSRKVVFPDGSPRPGQAPSGKRAFKDGVTDEATQDPREEHPGAAPAPRANIGCPAARQDRHHRRLHRRLVRRLHAHSSRPSVWVGYPNAEVPMTNVHGIAVAGGTFPARIWHDYMEVAKGTTAPTSRSRRRRSRRPPFFGKYAQHRRQRPGHVDENSVTGGGGRHRASRPTAPAAMAAAAAAPEAAAASTTSGSTSPRRSRSPRAPHSGSAHRVGALTQDAGGEPCRARRTARTSSGAPRSPAAY